MAIALTKPSIDLAAAFRRAALGLAKAISIGFSHTIWPPLPAPMMNHDLPKGIPSDSARSEKARLVVTQ